MHATGIAIFRTLTRSGLLLGLAIGLAGAVACITDEEAEQIQFMEPDRITVPAGTPLSAIAASNGIDLDELLLWNGLTSEVIERDVVLFIWPPTPVEAPAVAAVDAVDGVGEEPVAPATAPRPRPRSSSKGRSRGSSANHVVVVEPAVVASPNAPSGGSQLQIDRPSSVRSAGLLGALGGLEGSSGLSDDLAEGAAGLQAGGGTPGSAGLSARGEGRLGGGGTAEELGDIGRKPRTQVGGPDIGSGPIRAPRLSMPAAKRCLAAPTAAQLKSDDGYISNQSLTADQIRRSMGSFVRHTMSCIPSGTKGSYEIETELRVGCDGRVKDVWIIDRGALPQNVADCIAKTLHYASFPAHAVPDGVTFAYPIVYRY